MTIHDPLLFWPGLALLLLGWVLYWVALSTAMGVLFGGIGFTLGALAMLLADVQDPTHRIAILGGSALAGVLLGVVVFRFLHRVAFLITGALGGLAGGVAMLEHLRATSEAYWVQEPWAGLALGGGGAVMGAILMSALDKYVVAALSSVVGGVLMMMGTDWPWAGLPLVVIVPAGIAFQASLGSKARRHERDDDEEGDGD